MHALEYSTEEICVSTQFKNQKSKDQCDFLFDKYITEKRKNIGRLRNNTHTFPRIHLVLTDFVYEEDSLLRKVQEKIPIGISRPAHMRI